ncbi:MAG: LolA family protein [Steroidobacteraceae bacterium]
MLNRISTVMAASAVAWVMAFVPTAHGATQRSSPAAAAASQAPTPLDRYLKNLKTLSVSFLQTVADAHGAEVGRSSGTLTVERPGKFRWDIHPQSIGQGAASGQSATAGQSAAAGQQAGSAGSGQLMVSDGRNLWYYDRDLEQVTVRPVTAALSATPAMLLSGTVDVRKHFTESSAGTREGLDWVYVEPRSAEADFKSALFGFDGKGALQRMILQDKLGQVVTIVFHDVEVNIPVPAKEFAFTPPPGADVIGTPAH